MTSKVQTLFLVINQQWISGTNAVKFDISRSCPVSSSGVAFYILWSRSLTSVICLSHVRLQELPRPDWLVSSGSPSFTVKRCLLFCLLSQPLFRCSPVAWRLMGQTTGKESFLFKYVTSLQVGNLQRVAGDASTGELNRSGELHKQGTEEDSNYCWFIQGESYLCA